ncbi:coiled-coil domain-containing protein 83-like [Tubulanus polymorphus]|uniref:coiled-coil domain-containing protein 83-like n=1 Tax=Tubulanus polymorphus TaxID=672921 RepID=UPI003DA3547F
MGKKGKGKKSGKKKKGGKGKKKSSEPEMTFKEAILAYQIGIKEGQIQDIKYELRGMEEKNKRLRERNDRLKSEQVYYIQHLMHQAKEYEKQLDSAEPVTKDQVTVVMKEKWVAERQEKQDLVDLHAKIKELDEKVAVQQKEVEYWSDYKETGQHNRQTQIQLLEKELEDMHRSFEEMKNHLARTLDAAKSEIESKMENAMDSQKHYASEKAMSRLDKNSKQEVLDNDWLKREAVIHRRDYDELRVIVEELERRNLEIMSELFECKVEDLKISRAFYLTQFEEDEDLEQPGILEIDLSKLEITPVQSSTSLEDDEKPEPVSKRKIRPKSATQKAVEDKVFSMITAEQTDDDEEEMEDECGIVEEMLHEKSDLLDNYFNFDDEDWNDYLQLGPLELKLLNVVGEKIRVHTPIKLSTDEIRLKDCNPDSWPVTANMLHNF